MDRLNNGHIKKNLIWSAIQTNNQTVLKTSGNRQTYRHIDI